MPVRQMTYAELAALWSVTPEAARKKVEGLKLPRQIGNDGRVRVMIDLDEIQHHPQPKRDRRAAGDRAEVVALQAHVATLQAEIERLNALARDHRADFEIERARAEKAIADVVEMAGRLVTVERDHARKAIEVEQALAESRAATAATEAARAELDAWRCQPWWRRALG